MIKLPRAFLSHSAKDKDLVREVAAALGRAAVIFDSFEFSSGDDLKDAILKGIARSDIFVLFASQAAFTSSWVDFEIDTAMEAKTKQALSRVVTFIVDPQLPLESIPEWMRATLVVRRNEPGLIAIEIRRHINQRLAEKTPTYFVGRRNEIEQALDTISEFTDPNFRPPLVVYGLRGIGRRSLVQVIARDSLSFSTILPIAVQPGDLLPEAYIRLSESVSPGGISDFPGFLALQSAKSREDVVGEMLEVLRTSCNAGVLPVFVDEGAFAQSNGVLRPDFESLYDAISSDREVDAVIVSARRLYGGGGSDLPCLRVPELDSASTQHLLRIAGRDVGVVFDRADIGAVATYSRGYPPAVRFAIDEARTRGVSQVVSNQRALVNFSAELFLRQLADESSLNEGMTAMLQLLSAFSPLPLSVIAKYCGMSNQQAVDDMDRLLDLAFTLPEGLNFRITEPLRDAAYRAFGGLTVGSGRLADLLDEYLRDTPDDDARLSLGQTIFRASLLSGTGADSKFAVGFAADLIQVATQSYHDQDYDLAIKYGSSALEARPDNVDVRRYVAQALIRREKYQEAEEHIAVLIGLGELKEAFYIRGFAARRKREYSEAVEAYRKSLAYGRAGVAIHRELGSCYFELGDLATAEAHIRQAEERSPHNRYIVDLRCTIALRLGDLETAERTLEVLERVDPSGFADHRRSTFEQARGQPGPALSYARAANAKIAHPPFEVAANLANCEIEAGRAEDALTSLASIQKRFGPANHDAQTGLRCKYELRFGTVEAAEGLWHSLRDHGTPVHIGLRLAILNKKIASSGLSEKEQSEREHLLQQQSLAELERTERMIGSILSRSD
ncbi:MAG: TIR domain-containing protein [Parvibaculum sp.]|uniref:TIR domain-containing protein n=1 Tax=Parvibaculum sp. TaxID=2024848 RepID=UPI003266870F